MEENSTLCFCIEDESVWLAEKKVGFGTGKINGFGGKIKPGESAKEAAVRELKEEAGLIGRVSDLKPVALLYFYFKNQLRFVCKVYTLHKWEGARPRDTAEMKMAELYEFEKLPLGTDRMWKGDQKWLPRVLYGDKLIGRIYYNEDGTALDDFECKPATFKD